MIKAKLFIGFFVIVLTMIFGCTSKKSVEIPNMTSGIEIAMDTIIAKMEYIPLTASQISPSVERLLRGKVILLLPESFSTDTSDIHTYIGDLAVSNTYISWGGRFKVSAVEDTAILRSIALLEKVSQTELNSDLSFVGNNDSLEVYLNNYLEVDSLAHLQAYYEAISWLENLYITLIFSKNISNQKEYNNVIITQLNKGDELLDYLYDFQDYPPISDFSMLMLDILECRKSEINVIQLNDLVISLREHCHQTAQ